jgi:integrase
MVQSERPQRAEPRRVKLTRAFVERAKVGPGQERTTYWDTVLPKFGLEITAAGSKSYVVSYRVGRGRHAPRRQMTIDGTLEPDKARQQARKIHGAVAQGRDPLGEQRTAAKKAANSLKSICEAFLARKGGMERHDDGSVTFKDTRELRSAPRILDDFERLVYPEKIAGWSVDAIKRRQLNDLFDKVEDERGVVMADRLRSYLSSVFSWHAARDDDFASPFVRRMARTKPRERARDHTLDDDAIRIVEKVAGELKTPFARLMQFLLRTGARRNEASALTWDEISSADWTLPAARNKAKVDLVRPLTKQVLAALPARISGCKFVFSNDGKRPLSGYSKFKRTFDAAVLAELRKADPEAKPLPNWTLHDLRRTARSLMSRAGVPTDHAERCLGHVIGGVRGVYDRHEYYDEKQVAYEKLAAVIDRIINPPVGNVASLEERRAAAG